MCLFFFHNLSFFYTIINYILLDHKFFLIIIFFHFDSKFILQLVILFVVCLLVFLLPLGMFILVTYLPHASSLMMIGFNLFTEGSFPCMKLVEDKFGQISVQVAFYIFFRYVFRYMFLPVYKLVYQSAKQLSSGFFQGTVRSFGCPCISEQSFPTHVLLAVLFTPPVTLLAFAYRY